MSSSNNQPLLRSNLETPQPSQQVQNQEESPSAFDSVKQAASKRLSMPGLIKQARISLEKAIQLNENDFLRNLQHCQGIAFISTIKVGTLFWGGQGGTGIIIAKTERGTWSAPLAVGIGGCAWGLLLGASKSDNIILLNTQAAVKTFMSKGQLKLGVDAQLAMGNTGHDTEVGVGITTKRVAPVVSYSFAKGVFAGISFDGNIMAVRNKCNADFYGQNVSVADIASGAVTMSQSNQEYDRIVMLLYQYAPMSQPGSTNNNSNVPQY